MKAELDALHESIKCAVERNDSAQVTQGWRDIFRLYCSESQKRKDPEPDGTDADYDLLVKAALEAMSVLGGQDEITLHTLADYDHRIYGPLLGVSDQGSATKAIRHGALAAPKCQALGSHPPLSVGVAHDGERLGAVGEVVVGPDEYATIHLACRNRLLTTTNVGTRANIRHYLAPPCIKIRTNQNEDSVEKAAASLNRQLAKYASTPLGRGRHTTVYLYFDDNLTSKQHTDILCKLLERVPSIPNYHSSKHALGLFAKMKNGTLKEVRSIITLAKSVGLKKIALDGPVIEAAREAISLPGLLNFFTPEDLSEVIATVEKAGVKIGTRSAVDPQTTARHIWTGLHAARSMGFDLGKYGLLPLTFKEQKEVIARIQYWFPIWCAAPVFYIDYPLVTDKTVYYGTTLAAGIKQWLEMVAKLKVRVVLIDTAKKSEGRRLLKDGSDDQAGYLTFKEVTQLTKLGDEKGVKILWAGGITRPQAFQLGQLSVFGMYVTSAAARQVPLDRKARRDPSLITARMPDEKAVSRVKLAIEAGFHIKLGSPDIADLAKALYRLPATVDASEQEAELHAKLCAAWKDHFRRLGS